MVFANLMIGNPLQITLGVDIWSHLLPKISEFQKIERSDTEKMKKCPKNPHISAFWDFKYMLSMAN